MSAVMRPVFKPSQRIALKADGLLAEQIDRLEKHALPTIAAFKHSLPAKAKVRARIQNVGKHLVKAAEALAQMKSASFPDDGPEGTSIERLVSPVFRGAQARALPALDALTAYDLLVDRGDMPNLEAQLCELVELVSAAERQVMAGGAQRKRASWRPIEKINEEHLQGFVQHEQAEGRGVVRSGEWDASTPHRPMGPYLPLTVSNSGPFGRIAKICFVAAGITHSPDKHIRAWQAWDDRKRQRRVEERRKLNEALPDDEKYRKVDLELRPRRRGRPQRNK